MNIVKLFPAASFMNIAIIPTCVLHVHCLRMNPAWISSTVCKSSASGILPGPAPCTQDASCMLHGSVPGCISVLYPASIVSSLDGCILHWHCCPWLELPWFIVLHVEVIYFSMQRKARKLLGVLYMYTENEPQTLLQLYISLVRPHLEDASPSMESPLAEK